MNVKSKFAAALVRLYPARWRREYGAEFAAVLAQSPLGPRAFADILWNAIRQQFRLGEPWLLWGVPMLLLNLLQYTMLILYPTPYEHDLFSTGPVMTAINILWLVSIGYLTADRHRAGALSGGKAVFKMLLLMNWPMCLIAVLAATGVLRILPVGPGDAVTTFHQHGFAFTYYDASRRPPALAGLFLIPFLTAAEGFHWGLLGGAGARLFDRKLEIEH